MLLIRSQLSDRISPFFLPYFQYLKAVFKFGFSAEMLQQFPYG
jgi:hypothetical protein